MRARRADLHSGNPAHVVTRASRAALLGASLLLFGCGVDVQNGAGPRVPIPNVVGEVRRQASPAPRLQVELRNESGETISSTVTTISGAFGFKVTGSGPWEIKVTAGELADFESVTRTFWLQDSTLEELRAVDVYGYGASLLDPAADASAVAPNPVQPLIFRWTRPGLAGVTARVQLYDSNGMPVWYSGGLDADEVPWNGIGNQGTYQGQATQAGLYDWRVKFDLPDSSEARTPSRKLTLT